MVTQKESSKCTWARLSLLEDHEWKIRQQKKQNGVKLKNSNPATKEGTSMTVGRLTNALIKLVRTNPNPFMTYGEFGNAFGFNDKFPLAWANRNTLVSAAEVLKKDPQIGLDLTFLIRSSTTGFPSVIDRKPYTRHDKTQEQEARDVADQIIAKFALNVRNPYQ